MTDELEPDAPMWPEDEPSGAAWERVASVLESRIAPALERIAAALERSPAPAPVEAPPSRSRRIADVRKAIHQGQFTIARDSLSELSADHPDAPEISQLAEEMAAARISAATDRRKRLDAARASNDPEAVLNLRDELIEVIETPDREPLDRDLVRWVMGLLMKRLRSGTVAPDVASLAARVAESFGHLNEGASLRASLPTLRRSAGLCARCAKPYLGVEDACPECLALTPKIAPLPETPTSTT